VLFEKRMNTTFAKRYHQCVEVPATFCRQCYVETLTKAYSGIPDEVVDNVAEFVTGKKNADPIEAMAVDIVIKNYHDDISNFNGGDLITGIDSDNNYLTLSHRARFVHPRFYALERLTNIPEAVLRRTALHDALRAEVADDDNSWWIRVMNEEIAKEEIRVPNLTRILSFNTLCALTANPVATANHLWKSMINMSYLKATLITLMIRGQVVRGESDNIAEEPYNEWDNVLLDFDDDAEDYDIFSIPLFSHFTLVVSDLWNTTVWLYNGACYTCVITYEKTNDVVHYMNGTKLYSYAVVIVVVLASILFLRFRRYIVDKLKAWSEYKLAAKDNVGPDRFISKRINELGVTYTFIVNGKYVEIPVSNEVAREDEMALPGSELYPSIKREVGAILVATENTELTLVGCFWRYGDYFVTAKHVANAVSSGIADVYLTGVAEARRGTWRLDMANVMRVDKELFTLENNEFNLEYDIFAVKFKPALWSKLKISQVSTKLKSSFNQEISAVGFRDGLMMTSAGKTSNKSTLVELYHSATTHKGFSGSPLFSGSSVVGMHIAADCNRNVAMRIELIKDQLDRKNESNRPDDDGYELDFKMHGRSTRWDEYDGGMGYMDRQGRVAFGYTRDDFNRLYDASYDREDEEDELDRQASNLVSRKHKKTSYSYTDENAGSAMLIQKDKPVHCGKTPQSQPVATNYIDERLEELTKMGYDPTKYVWPVINADTEKRSLLNHLDLYSDRIKSIKVNSTNKQYRRAVMITVQQMSANRYEAPKNYRAASNLKRIINSSLVKDSKSPGQPYQSMSLMTNEAVLKHYGVDGFCEVVENNWDEDFVLKVFLKAEPTKGDKIEKGMPRIITGFPLHKMVKNQAVFENVRAALVDNWMESPVKYCFSPLVPGHIRHLSECFDGKVYASDKSNWDFNCFDFVYQMAADVIVELAVQPDDMTDEEFSTYLQDVRQCVNEASVASKYRCTNGEVYQSNYDGIMKSGWLMTIDFNSISQLLIDNLIKVHMDLSDEDILNMPIIVGGDDVLQGFSDGFDTGKYLNIAAELGFKLSDFVVTKTFNHSEFFSNKFEFKEGVWTFHPERFTKHIEKLRMNKVEDLAGTLVSHMLNHVWSKSKFSFFEKMYKNLRKDRPDLFPLSLLKSQRQLQYKVIGVEGA
jgi:hypothetical protein